jgi:hypothetical protein
MYGEIACVTMVLLGIEVGYRPRSEGGMEYLIQVDAQNLESLKSGMPLESAIPPKVRDVRAYRITFGAGPLPKTLPAPSAEKPEKSRPPEIEHPRYEKIPTPNPVSTPPDPFRHTHPGGGFSAADRAALPRWDDSRPGPASPSRPRTFPHEPASSPIPEQSASFSEPGATAAERPAAEAKSAASAETTKKPWAPLVLFVVLFVGSATCNGYLAFLLYEGRRRYRKLMGRIKDEG